MTKHMKLMTKHMELMTKYMELTKNASDNEKIENKINKLIADIKKE